MSFLDTSLQCGRLDYGNILLGLLFHVIILLIIPNPTKACLTTVLK